MGYMTVETAVSVVSTHRVLQVVTGVIVKQALLPQPMCTLITQIQRRA